MKDVWQMRLWLVFGAVGLFSAGCGTMWGVSFTYTTVSYPGTGFTSFAGIDDAGQVAGSWSGVSGTEPFVYANGVFNPVVVTGIPGANSVAALAINNVGTILVDDAVGSQYEVNGSSIAPVAVPGAIYSFANGINDLGQIVGEYAYSNEPTGAFLYAGGTYQGLNIPGNYYPDANGINNLGQIVGTVYVNNSQEGFLYQGGTFQTISVPGAAATVPEGINNLGEIVGVYGVQTGFNINYYGFVDIGGQFSTISAPPGFSTDNVAINDLGQIAGTWSESSFEQIGFIGTPVGGPVSLAPTPEPGTIGLVGTGVVAMAGVVRRRWLMSA